VPLSSDDKQADEARRDISDPEKVPERGYKPEFYVVWRDFIAENEDVSTVVCAPVYREVLGVRSEVVLAEEDGLPHESAVRGDFLALMFKNKLTQFVAALSSRKLRRLNDALKYALDLDD
jgi:mRNA-degrading endonuclease toxin of MazEF toxin-antitoxin module